jgi:NTP pyrophosphatase (non-canonical NTP hydrolase)
MNIKKETLLRCIGRWGERAQLYMAIEEMAELTKEIIKYFRGTNNREHIIEETADVILVIEQLKYLFSITDDELQKAIDFKINRVENRLER